VLFDEACREPDGLIGSRPIFEETRRDERLVRDADRVSNEPGISLTSATNLPRIC